MWFCSTFWLWLSWGSLFGKGNTLLIPRGKCLVSVIKLLITLCVSGDTIVCVAVFLSAVVRMWLWEAGDKENVLNLDQKKCI